MKIMDVCLRLSRESVFVALSGFAASYVFPEDALPSVAAAEEFEIPLAQSLPTIDGVLADGEWDEGVMLAGFKTRSSGGMMITGGDGYVTFLSDGRTLFVSFRTKANNIDIGGGLVAKATQRDGATYSDDCVELVVQTGGDSPIAHFVFNSIGTVYDSRTTVQGEADVSWNSQGLKVASDVRAGWWVLEASVPLSELGGAGDGVWVNAARGFSGLGSASLNGTSSHVAGPKFRLNFIPKAFGIHFYDLGNPLAGHWSPKISLSSGAVGELVKCQLRLYEDEGKTNRVLASAERTIKVGQTAGLRFETRLRKRLRLEVQASDAKSGRALFLRTIVACRGNQVGRVPPTAIVDLEDAEVLIYHYPSLGKMRVDALTVPSSGMREIRCNLAGRETVLQGGRCGFTALVDVPTVDGDYPIDFVLTGDRGSRRIPKAWTIRRRRQAWEQNVIGKDRRILSPFKPIAADGDKVRFLLNDCRFGAAGLLSSVNSLGREILSAPLSLEAVVNGKPILFSGSSPKIRVAQDGYDAEIEGEVASDGIAIAVRGRIEQDGFVWYDLAVQGASGRKIDRLTLVVPFRNAEVPLMHACTVDSIRFNPAGALPAGEGVVWDGTKLHHPPSDFVADQFVPYVWLGAERRGLCWFMNSSLGLRLDKAKPSVRIVRKGDVVRMEADFVNRKADIADGHVFSFGVQPTPVKKANRALGRYFQSSAGFCPPGLTPRFFLPLTTLGFWNPWARTPWRGDWSLMDLASSCAKRGDDSCKPFAAAYSAEVSATRESFARYARGVSGVDGVCYEKWVRGLADWGAVKIANIHPGAFTVTYSDPTLNWEEEEAQKLFRSEWVSRKTSYSGAERNFLTPSYLDYAVYSLWQRAEHGVEGVYLDDMFPMVCQNKDTSVKCDTDGSHHGSVGILEMRELVRRLAVMLDDRHVEPRLLQVHMTNCLLIPCFSFATSAVTWEDHYGEDVFQKRFAADYVRAESLGGQLGVESIALDGIQRRRTPETQWKERFAYLSRTQQSMLLPMGMKISVRSASAISGVETNLLTRVYGALERFGCWSDGVEFLPAYEDDHTVSGVPESIWIGRYSRPGRLLLALGNQGGEAVEFSPIPDVKRLGLAGRLRYLDAETGTKIDGMVRIPAYDFKLVEIRDSTLDVLEPEEDEVVSQLKPTQKRMLQSSWAECRRYFDGGQRSRALTADGCLPRSVRLAWKGGVAPYEVSVFREPDDKPFCNLRTERRCVELDSLEIGRRWRWTLRDAVGNVRSGHFRTEDMAPRLIRIKGVPNVRDLGGRRGLDGRRIRQGLLFRSAGLNDNSTEVDGVKKPVRQRLTEEERQRLKTTYNFKADLDLRRPDEIFGMKESPLGPDVKWINLRYATYESITNQGSRVRAARIYREILQTNNYPLVFHCIAGADRTGTLSFVLNGLLGVSQEEALKDYLATGFSDHGVTDPRHLKNLEAMVKALDGFSGRTFAEKVETHFMELGFSASELTAFREFMLEEDCNVQRKGMTNE